MKKTLFILLVGLVYYSNSQAQDTILLKNTITILGHIQKIDTEQVFYYTDANIQDSLYSVALTEVEEIKYETTMLEQPIDVSLLPVEKQPFIHWKDRKKNILSAQLLGSSVITGLTYSRVIGGGEKFFLTAGVGAGFAPFGASIPHHITFATGRGEHYFEASLNGSFVWGNNWNDKYGFYGISPSVGYRLQLKEGFMFRIFGGPVVLAHQKIVSTWAGEIQWPTLLPFIGMDFGYSF